MDTLAGVSPCSCLDYSQLALLFFFSPPPPPPPPALPLCNIASLLCHGLGWGRLFFSSQREVLVLVLVVSVLGWMDRREEGEREDCT